MSMNNEKYNTKILFDDCDLFNDNKNLDTSLVDEILSKYEGHELRDAQNAIQGAYLVGNGIIINDENTIYSIVERKSGCNIAYWVRKTTVQIIDIKHDPDQLDDWDQHVCYFSLRDGRISSIHDLNHCGGASVMIDFTYLDLGIENYQLSGVIHSSDGLASHAVLEYADNYRKVFSKIKNMFRFFALLEEQYGLRFDDDFGWYVNVPESGCFAPQAKQSTQSLGGAFRHITALMFALPEQGEGHRRSMCSAISRIFRLPVLSDSYRYFADASPIVSSERAGVIAHNADIQVSDLRLDKSEIAEGENTTVRFTVSNKGAAHYNGSVIQGVYISKNAKFDSTAKLIDSDNAGTVYRGEVDSSAYEYLCLSGYKTGTYYIYVKGDCNNRASESSEGSKVATTKLIIKPGTLARLNNALHMQAIKDLRGVLDAFGHDGTCLSSTAAWYVGCGSVGYNGGVPRSDVSGTVADWDGKLQQTVTAIPACLFRDERHKPTIGDGYIFKSGAGWNDIVQSLLNAGYNVRCNTTGKYTGCRPSYGSQSVPMFTWSMLTDAGRVEFNGLGSGGVLDTQGVKDLPGVLDGFDHDGAYLSGMAAWRVGCSSVGCNGGAPRSDVSGTVADWDDKHRQTAMPIPVWSFRDERRKPTIGDGYIFTGVIDPCEHNAIEIGIMAHIDAGKTGVTNMNGLGEKMANRNQLSQLH